MRAQEALDLLRPIPKENWIEGIYTNSQDSCCVIGHLQRLTSENPEDYTLLNCSDAYGLNPMRGSTGKYLMSKYTLPYTIVDVNNSEEVNGYTENNPKDRVIHLLEDMVRDGY